MNVIPASLQPILSLVGLVILWNFFFRKKSKSGQEGSLPTLSLIEFQHEPGEVNPDDPVMELLARRSGWIVPVIMGALGLGTRSRIRITGEELRISLSSWSGVQTFVAPLSEITTADLRVEKPAWALWAGVFGLIGGVIGLLGPVLASSLLGRSSSRYYYGSFDLVSSALAALLNVGVAPPIVILVISLLLFFWYWWRKRFVVAFSTGNLSDRYGMAFRPNRLLGVNVSVESLLESIHHVNDLIINAHTAPAASSS
jgi:hypothetical protein